MYLVFAVLELKFIKDISHDAVISMIALQTGIQIQKNTENCHFELVWYGAKRVASSKNKKSYK